ncbi:MAG: dTDP-glucose 4,6-dehydratase [Nitrospirae bacterium]|nr:MAG: dTDP-glucose 4,6-dehydratase [Nitrospirota bacterium]
MKRLLVTGGAGFIGSEFVRQGVRKGYSIILADSLTYAGDLLRIKEFEKEISLHRVSVTDKAGVEKIFDAEKPDAVIHWAAESHVDRSIMDAGPFLNTNVLGTQTLLDAARKFGVERFINISTDEVYGDLDGSGSFFETTPLSPNSPYSVSKASADMLGRAYHRTYGLPVITVRPSNNYGPWQYPEKLVPVVIVKALNNEEVPVYAQGLNVREWLYVSDCADAVFRILEKGKAGDIYNIGSGEERKNIEVVKSILKMLGKPEDLVRFTKDRPGHDFRYSLDSGKLRGELSWRPAVDFDSGLNRTVEWFLSNMSWVDAKITYLKEYWEKAYS